MIGRLMNCKKSSSVEWIFDMKKGILILAFCMLISFTGCGSLVDKGADLLAEEKYGEAQEVFQEAIEKEKNLSEAYRGLGIAYMEQSEYEKALWAFEKALGEGTKETAVLDNLMGICGLRSEQYQKAADFFEKAAVGSELNEELSREIIWNLVVSYEGQGDYQKAKEKLEQYLEAYPEDEKALKEQEFLKTQS